MNSVYYGGCWATNIGNAFIDFGALHVCRKYNPFLFSEYDYCMFKNRNCYFNIFSDIKPKCVFFSGMVTCKQFIIDQKEIFDILDENNIPVVLNGVGGENYSDGEKIEFRNFIKKHKFAGFISRDDETFDAYADLFSASFRGIDVAFFLSETNSFRGLLEMEKKHIVVNEDDLGFNRKINEIQEYKNANENEIVYTHHQLTNMPYSYTNTKRSMLSELPHTYVYMYGMSKFTITTRVHACIATLSFGGKATLLYNTPRSKLFDRVGCHDISERFCSVDMQLLNDKKAEHMCALETIMNNI